MSLQKDDNYSPDGFLLVLSYLHCFIASSITRIVKVYLSWLCVRQLHSQLCQYVSDQVNSGYIP